MNSEGFDIAGLDAQKLLLKLDEFKHEAQKAGEKFVELETVAREMKMKSDAVLAYMIKHFICEDESYNVAKCYAVCSEEFKAAQVKQSRAEHEMNLMKIDYDLAKSAIRTLESIGYVRNNELKMLRS